ncbi:MAG: riboflavin synthase [Candidatus Kapabacteria bacterium]|nr:riboflavin synthase [Candidatus Kapabacteria bacterium]
MFTGIIEEIGTLRRISHNGGGRRIAVEADKIIPTLQIDDSVSLNGACQTVVAINGKVFEVEAVEETLKKTTLGSFTANKKINLETAVTPSTHLGGHLVQGHVDCVGRVLKVENLSRSRMITIAFPAEFERYIIPVGSICVNGVSLTAAQVEGVTFTLAVIPHTLSKTTLSELVPGMEVNLEFDLIGKYVERMMKFGVVNSSSSALDQYIDQPF